jgi:hypothetical protein
MRAETERLQDILDAIVQNNLPSLKSTVERMLQELGEL